MQALLADGTRALAARRRTAVDVAGAQRLGRQRATALAAFYERHQRLHRWLL